MFVLSENLNPDSSLQVIEDYIHYMTERINNFSVVTQKQINNIEKRLETLETIITALTTVIPTNDKIVMQSQPQSGGSSVKTFKITVDYNGNLNIVQEN